jgi:hypothetical protein
MVFKSILLVDSVIPWNYPMEEALSLPSLCPHTPDLGALWRELSVLRSLSKRNNYSQHGLLVFLEALVLLCGSMFLDLVSCKGGWPLPKPHLQGLLWGGGGHLTSHSTHNLSDCSSGPQAALSRWSGFLPKLLQIIKLRVTLAPGWGWLASQVDRLAGGSHREELGFIL